MVTNTVLPYLDKLKNHHVAVSNLLKKLQEASAVSGKISDTEIENLRKAYQHLLLKDKELKIDYNNLYSEGDLIPLHERQQKIALDDQIYKAHTQVYDLFRRIEPSPSPQPTPINNKESLLSHLSEDELNTKVLDAHAFYRIIYEKAGTREYDNSQFDLVFNNISEKLSKTPMTIASIKSFYKENGIPQLTDEEFRGLIKSVDKDYTNAENSIREIHKNDFVTGTLTHQYVRNNAYGGNNGELLKDADSFYKLIYNKMVLNEYSSREFNQLYVNISEKLVHSPILKSEIIKFYAEKNIKQLAEADWNTLFNRQETRITPQYITTHNHGLDFQGTVQIKDKQDFKLNIHLYYAPIVDKTSSNQYLNTISNILSDTANHFNKYFGIRRLESASNFRLFIFENKEEYLKYFPEARGYASASDNGNISSIYIFKGDNNYQDDFDLLRHEFAHALTYQSTAKLNLPSILMEGIAEYIVHKMSGKSSVDFFKLIPADNYIRSIKQIVCDPLNEADFYLTGAALVAFLEETSPHFIENLLYAAQEARKNDRHIKVHEMLQNLFNKYENQSLQEIPWFKNNLSTTHADIDRTPRSRRSSDLQTEFDPSTPILIGTNKEVNNSQPNVEIIELDYFQIKELYETVGEAEKSSVMTLWRKLHEANYKVDTSTSNFDASEHRYIHSLQSRKNTNGVLKEPSPGTPTEPHNTQSTNPSDPAFHVDGLVEKMSAMSPPGQATLSTQQDTHNFTNYAITGSNS